MDELTIAALKHLADIGYIDQIHVFEPVTLTDRFKSFGKLLRMC